MKAQHSYTVNVEWLGNRGTGTSSYRAYSREHRVSAPGKRHDIDGSADKTFFGDAERWNPEENLLAALSQCHMLSYLHVAGEAGVVVTAYTDAATGTMQTRADGGGAFTEATLHPRVTIAAGSDPDRARELHKKARELCFIANSVNFPVNHEVDILRAE